MAPMSKMVLRPRVEHGDQVGVAHANNFSQRCRPLSARACASVTGVSGCDESWRHLKSMPPGVTPCWRAAGRMALDVHGDRIYRDVGGGDLDVNGTRSSGRPSCGPMPSSFTASTIRPRSWRFGIGTGGAERARRRDLGDVHAEVRGADADPDDGRRADPAAALITLSMTKRLIASRRRRESASAGTSRSPSPSPGIISTDGLCAHRNRLNDRHADAAGGLLVLAGSGCTTEEQRFSVVARAQPRRIAPSSRCRRTRRSCR